MRIFRQLQVRDWKSVMEEVRQALEHRKQVIAAAA
jgi:hypothetical protein